MNPWIHSLLQSLEDKLTYLSAEDSLQACKEACAELSGYMERYAFSSRAEEVLYFKTFKPRFMAHRLKYEILVSGESMDPFDVAPWFRNYYAGGENKADSIHFSSRACRKTDFDLPIKASSPAGWQTADKLVARLLIEEWFKNACQIQTA